MDNCKIAEIERDVQERRDIISDYYKTRILNRELTIRTIRKLRITDKNVAKVTAANLAVSAVPFDKATDDQLVAELEMQIIILNSEMLCDCNKDSHGSF